MAQEKENPRDFYIIDTKTRTAPAGRDWEYVDPLANKEYQRLTKSVELGTIGDEFPRLDPRLYGNPANFHKPEHLTKECFKYATRPDGTIWFPKGEEKLASRILYELQSIDSDVRQSSFGMDIPPHEPEATPEEDERASFRQAIRRAS